MLPSIQCIFERWLAGLGVILAGVVLIGGGGWCLGRLFTGIADATGTLATVIEWTAKIAVISLLIGGFVFGGYFIGKDLLTSFGICHLR